MSRTDIINILIKKFEYKTYLEVGTQYTSNNFDKIIIDKKVSIDPYPMDPVTFVGTSDEYFESITDDVKFDIIFIDGLHHDDQVLKDIDNSLKHLSENGTIVCHDCLPSAEYMQMREFNGGTWTGDVWKAIVELRINSTDLTIKIVNTDYGCGVIRRGVNIPYVPNGDYKSYSYFELNKYQMLNVISPEEFIQWVFS